MNKDSLCVGARAAMGEHTCALWLRPVGEIPGGLWSWSVYVDGDIHSRGPGSKRKDLKHWYASLLPGAHRLIVRESDTNNPNTKESNALHFTVEKQTDIQVDVSFISGEINLVISSGKEQAVANHGFNPDAAEKRGPG